MKLSSLLSEHNILINPMVENKEEAIRQLLDTFENQLDASVRERALELLMAREQKFSSYVGDGVAIPHTRVDGVHRIHVGLLTSLGGFVAEDAQDKQTIHILFIILTPPDKNTLMLQTLAAVARLCRTKDIRESLRRTKTPSRIIKQIEEIGIDVKSTITAADVMQTPPSPLQPEMPLKEALEQIIEKAVDGLPVTDAQGKLLGELSSLEVLKIGLPKYVDILKDDSFLTQFEPFEDYFQREEALKVREVMTREMATAEEDTPIIKIANMLVSNNKNCAYVTRDGKLNGVVYRRELLSKVLQV